MVSSKGRRRFQEDDHLAFTTIYAGSDVMRNIPFSCEPLTRAQPWNGYLSSILPPSFRFFLNRDEV